MVAQAVEIRFYGVLVRLLATPEPTVTLPVGVPPSIKDAVESLGVPHTEVGLLVADGEPVGWDHRLAAGARIAVYPPFRAIDVTGVTQVAAPAPEPMRFLLDVHLGRLARHLRLLGLDARHDPAADDAELADVAVAQSRVLLTRDLGLLKRTAVRHGGFVHAIHPFEQVVEIARRFDLMGRAVPFTRCLACNGELAPIDAAVARPRVPAAVRARHDDYRTCRDCGRIYWEGSHHRKLVALVAAIEAAVSGAAAPPAGTPPGA